MENNLSTLGTDQCYAAMQSGTILGTPEWAAYRMCSMQHPVLRSVMYVKVTEFVLDYQVRHY